MSIILEKKGKIAKVGLNNQATMNAFDPDELLRLNEVWNQCREDKDIRVVVLHSMLENIFCSGLNTKTALPLWAGIREPKTAAEKWFVNDNESVGKAM